MATLYFNAAVDNDWDTLGNWWTDSGHTGAAAGLPESGDSVVISGTLVGGEDHTVVNLTANSASIGPSFTVTGAATFDGSSEYHGQLTGNATFNGTASLTGTVSGNATFNEYAFLDPTGTAYDIPVGVYSEGTPCVGGLATFNDNSYWASSVNVVGSAVFNDSSRIIDSGAYMITGVAVFNDESSVEDADPVVFGGGATFRDRSLLGGCIAVGDVLLRDASRMVAFRGGSDDWGIGLTLNLDRKFGVNGSSILGVV
jgi:hypothetical protein